MLGLRSVSRSIEESRTRKTRQSRGKMSCQGRILITTCLKPNGDGKERDVCVETIWKQPYWGTEMIFICFKEPIHTNITTNKFM